jgi:hypothetical protein
MSEGIDRVWRYKPIAESLGISTKTLQRLIARGEIATVHITDHAIRAGELLLEAKREVAHGEWESWLQANVPFQPRTARAYMQLARLDPEKRQRRRSIFPLLGLGYPANIIRRDSSWLRVSRT